MSCDNDTKNLEKFSRMDRGLLVGMAAIRHDHMAEDAIVPIFGHNPLMDKTPRKIGWEIVGVEKPMCNTCDYMNQKFKRQSICRSCSQFYQDLHSNNKEQK